MWGHQPIVRGTRCHLTPTPPERFETAFRAHSRDVLGFALRRTDQTADAADVVAETFLIAWRRIDDLPTGADARPWLFAVARNVMANQRRGARRRERLAARLGAEVDAQLLHTSPVAPDPEVRAAFAGLRPADREILALHAWEDLDPSAIATVLGISQVAARTRLHRARARMRRALERGSADPDRGPVPRPPHTTPGASDERRP